MLLIKIHRVRRREFLNLMLPADDGDAVRMMRHQRMAHFLVKTPFGAVVGALLTLPGASYLAGLDEIHKLKYSTTLTVLVVVGFNLVMLWLLEVPLASFLVAPDWTPRAVQRAKLWVSRHAHAFAVRGSAAAGVLLVIKGIVGLAG